MFARYMCNCMLSNIAKHILAVFLSVSEKLNHSERCHFYIEVILMITCVTEMYREIERFGCHWIWILSTHCITSQS